MTQEQYEHGPDRQGMTTPELSDSKNNAYPLIGPGDPEPFTVLNRDGRARALIVADHASAAFPKAMNHLGLDDSVLGLHVASDIGSADMARRLSERLDAPAVLAGYSRLIVDCNRQLYDPTAFIRVSDGIAVPGNQDLTEEDKAKRVKSFFDPYHGAVAEQLERFYVRGITPALISLHSCTPVFDRVVRPWHIGVLWDRDIRIAEPLLENLSMAEGVHVGDNEPYSGKHPHDYTIDMHAEPAGIPHVGIEVRQDLIDSPAAAREWADVLYDALAPVLANDALYQRFKP